MTGGKEKDMHIDNLISGIEEEQKEMNNAQQKHKEVYTGAKHKTELSDNTETDEPKETENKETENKETENNETENKEESEE